ncbi:hypothetical protein GOZ94_26550 [Agrobacterium vitis]|uniref:hypothetical protein n=1 Tax=Agrobacterium vitis TaxID=373 RepID=UPI0012E71593|nr:hypothetical protein [Agrobacterium vitis]MVA22484.1 hypothetical protein [Agrobacterium vitis]
MPKSARKRQNIEQIRTLLSADTLYHRVLIQKVKMSACIMEVSQQIWQWHHSRSGWVESTFRADVKYGAASSLPLSSASERAARQYASKGLKPTATCGSEASITVPETIDVTFSVGTASGMAIAADRALMFRSKVL